MSRTLLCMIGLMLAACGPLPQTAEPEPSPTPLPPTTPLPQGVLIVYTRAGGIAGTLLTLQVDVDGAAHLESSQSPEVSWQVSNEHLASLKRHLEQAEFAALPGDPHSAGVCADCYAYTVTARTPQGVKTLQFDDADLDPLENHSPLFGELAGLMDAIAKSAPQPTASPLGEAGPGEGVLIVFHQEGGLAYSSSTLTIQRDGSATLEGTELSGPVNWQLDADTLAQLEALVTDPTFLIEAGERSRVCADCYVYTVSVYVHGGVTIRQTDDAALSTGQTPALQKLLELLNRVKEGAPGD